MFSAVSWSDFRWAVDLLESVICWDNSPNCCLSPSPCSLQAEHYTSGNSYTFLSTTPHLPSVPALHFLQREMGLSAILIWSPFLSSVFSLSPCHEQLRCSERAESRAPRTEKLKPLYLFWIFGGLSLRTMKAIQIKDCEVYTRVLQISKATTQSWSKFFFWREPLGPHK